MKIEIPIKPLSINDAHQGRHIKTKEFIQYEKDISRLLPINRKAVSDGEYFIRHVFYLKNYKLSDTGNFEKILTDLLVKRGYLKDDRYVKAFYLEKRSVKDSIHERTVTDIVPYDERHLLLGETTPLPSSTPSL